MKKFILVAILAVALAAGAFADHPDNWGIGLMGRGGWGYGDGGFGGTSLTLKAPKLPIYWGINLDLWYRYFGIGVSGDYYLIDSNLADFDSAHLGWYLGLGAFAGFGSYGGAGWSYNWTRVTLGARLPIGLSFQLPLSSIKLEVFGAAVPNIGVGFYFGDYSYDNRSSIGLIGGIGGEGGFRIWF